MLTPGRCAFDLDFLISRQPHSGVKSYYPTRANTPGPNELEYLDVFDIFNFPRMPIAVSNESMESREQGQDQGLAQGQSTSLEAANGTMIIPNFAMPNPEADWLFLPT